MLDLSKLSVEIVGAYQPVSPTEISLPLPNRKLAVPEPAYVFRQVGRGWYIRFSLADGRVEESCCGKSKGALYHQRILQHKPFFPVSGLHIEVGHAAPGTLRSAISQEEYLDHIGDRHPRRYQSQVSKRDRTMDKEGHSDLKDAIRHLKDDIDLELEKESADFAKIKKLEEELDQLQICERKSVDRYGNPRLLTASDPDFQQVWRVERNLRSFRKLIADDMPTFLKYIRRWIWQEGADWFYCPPHILDWQF
jgi:hypothetical protein